MSIQINLSGVCLAHSYLFSSACSGSRAVAYLPQPGKRVHISVYPLTLHLLRTIKKNQQQPYTLTECACLKNKYYCFDIGDLHYFASQLIGNLIKQYIPLLSSLYISHLIIPLQFPLCSIFLKKVLEHSLNPSLIQNKKKNSLLISSVEDRHPMEGAITSPSICCL